MWSFRHATLTDNWIVEYEDDTGNKHPILNIPNMSEDMVAGLTIDLERSSARPCNAMTQKKKRSL